MVNLYDIVDRVSGLNMSTRTSHEYFEGVELSITIYSVRSFITKISQTSRPRQYWMSTPAVNSPKVSWARFPEAG